MADVENVAVEVQPATPPSDEEEKDYSVDPEPGSGSESDAAAQEPSEDAVTSLPAQAPGHGSDTEESEPEREKPLPPPPEDRIDLSEHPHGGDPPQRPEQPRSRTPQTGRGRTDSASTAGTSGTAGTAPRGGTRSSLVFVISALETIAASKDARRIKELGESSQKALEALRGAGDPTRISPEVLFLPLHLATEAHTLQVVTVALDCIGKLISYSYFSTPADPHATPEGPPLIERAIDTICDCFQGEATPVDIQVQIIKSLLAAILNDKIVVHGAGLLKAVRLTYNIFLLSKSNENQQLAQTALTQMVGTVFERVKGRLAMKEGRMNLSKVALGKTDSEEYMVEQGGRAVVVDPSEVNGELGKGDAPDEASSVPNDTPVDEHTGPKITLQSFEHRKSFDDARIQDNAPTLVTHVKDRPAPVRAVTGQEDNYSSAATHGTSEASEDEEEDEIYIKDAYLVFRAMCKLSTKTLPVEHAVDVRSQGMRSKLISLHIIHTILHNNIIVFISPFVTIKSSSNDEPAPFVQAIKQHLCLSLSRNGASSVTRVFEVSCEIFWLMLRHLRVVLKKELEVFLKEIYLAILEKRNSPVFQKQHILTVLGRLAADGRALVEVFLNYDCDRTALDNMFQRIIENLSRIASIPVHTSAVQQQAHQELRSKHTDWQHRGTLPLLSVASMNAPPEPEQGYPQEYGMKLEALESVVKILRSLVSWAQQGIEEASKTVGDPESRISWENSRESIEQRDTSAGQTASPSLSSGISGIETPLGPGTPLAEDDPSQLSREKQRKNAIANATKQFNFKPSRGIKLLLKEGFIKSEAPHDVAIFFLHNERIDKKALGEFLGEGDPFNVAVMHAFVDGMDFNKTRFVDALRRFLQSFRLPGEAQKIDRFMLKFAERYISGNPNAFANADTAYVLAYSVIMLNTDQHSKEVKKRMTPEDFIKNNRGINDNADLPDDYLRGIFEEIGHNEIVLNTEREAAANIGLVAQPSGGLTAGIGQALATVGRDLQKEAYMQASEEMANKTEQLYKSLLRAQRRSASRMPVSKFIPASSFKHVGPMMEVTWMPFLTALSGPAQDTHNIHAIKLCMEGQKLAIRLACLFDLQNPRQAFVANLARFTNLYNLKEMKAKNIEALKVLLEVAHTEGNGLKESWRDILTCISQLDRFQLISTGVDQEAVPDVLKAHVQTRGGAPNTRKSLQVPNRTRSRSQSNVHYHSEIAEESRSADMIRGVDRIFTNTANLSGEAIVYFVKALTQVSWQEIQSSGQSESPRTYSLQKIVEISGYNMTRVRFEWTSIWQVLGEHFNQVGCHTNTNVVFFALNSLRQLAMRFMEIEELPGFKFQKDFLRPFEHIIANSNVVSVKDMVLRCLDQMIQARGDNIRSGWRTMFGVFTVAAKEQYEGIVNLAFDNVIKIYNHRFGVVISQGAFADLIVCLTEFSKNFKFQKKSLQAIESLKSSVSKMLRTPECPLSERAGLVKDAPQSAGLPKQPSRQTEEEQFWFPVLFAFHDVLMTGEDMEVRSKALDYLFDMLIKYGGQFPQDFWDTLWRQLLYPIFMVLRSKSEMSKVLNHEELSVWLSSTMIQALRNMITLFTHFFGSLEYMLDRFLELLTLCICQENDTLARIGSNCLQQLILQNVTKFTPEHWNQIVGAFVELFSRTEASQLFSAATSSSYTPSLSSNGVKSAKTPHADGANVTDLPLSETPIDEKAEPDINALGINGLPSGPASSAVTDDDPSGTTNATLGTAATTTGSPASSTNRSPSPLPRRKTSELEDYHRPETELQQPPVVVTAARRRFFNQIITKCVLQLLMIETVNELFTNDAVYASIPSPELLRLMALLKHSYHFAKRFNNDRHLRTRLFREGFMKQPPNLLKQESGAAAVYVAILLRMYHDAATERAANRAATEQALVPLCVDIVRRYVDLDEDTQQRNIATWRPVVVDVLDGLAGFPPHALDHHARTVAPLLVGLLNRDPLGSDLQRALQGLLVRVFELKLDVPAKDMPVRPPQGSPRGSVFGGRRGSSRIH